MASPITNRCEICDIEKPAVSTKLWVKGFYRKKMMCKDCIITVRDLAKSGVECGVEQYSDGEEETNYLCVKKYKDSKYHNKKSGENNE